jgi:hypothetical protein
MPVIAASAAAFAAVTSVTAYIGYLLMFAGFQNYDDEGFMLMSLRSFLSGHPLYDQVVVQYGPFYYEVFGVLGVLGVPFDHDSGRLVTLAVWLAIALLAGMAIFAFTGNLALGLGSQLITFTTAVALTGEPMHPGGLVSFLVIGVAAVALISAGRRPGRWPFFVMGALVAAALLTKINVGVFAAMSVGFACAMTFPTLARAWPVRLAASTLIVVVPFALMKSDLGASWAQLYSVNVAVTALALVVVTSVSRPDADRRLLEVGWLLAGGCVLALGVIAIALVDGTSPNGLLHGVILFPLDQRQAFAFPLTLPATTLAWDAISLGIALAWALYRFFIHRPQVAIEGWIRLGVGLLVWVTLLGQVHIPGLLQLTPLNNRIGLPIALAWVVAAPRAKPDGYAKLDFARALLAALAILESLQAFPVAGSQALEAALPLVPVGAICIFDGLGQLGLERVRLQLATWLVFLTLGAGWLPQTWQQTRATYASDVPLGLPGASRVRVPADQAALLGQVNQAIRDNCETFISVPGLDSFYIFSRLKPPGSAPTRWIWLIGDASAQQAVIDASQQVGRLCVVENDSLIAFWTQGRHVGGPLEAYIQGGFGTLYTIGPYSVLVRPSPLSH